MLDKRTDSAGHTGGTPHGGTPHNEPIEGFGNGDIPPMGDHPQDLPF
jgi:hypothetical protein